MFVKAAVHGAGSVKACYGHTEGAAGIHGALLAVSVVQKQVGCSVAHRTIIVAPVMHFVAWPN
jgi:3-oxoacyl-(acyl-carrier-protein) synthase